MATITRVGTPSIVTLNPPINCQRKGIAGEAIAAGDVLYQKASDGLFYKAGGGSNGEQYRSYVGMAMAAASAGEAVTAFSALEVRYGSGLTVGATVFPETTAGLVGDANAINTDSQIGRVVSATNIYLYPLRHIA